MAFARLIIPLIGLGLYSCSPQVVNQLSFQQTPVVADGKALEWEGFANYDSDSKIAYTISNDFQNLYIYLTTLDQSTQVKVMRAGMQIQLDTTGKKKYHVGISYPLATGKKVSREEMRAQMGNSQASKPDLSQMRNKFLMEQVVMNVYGFRGMEDGITTLRNTDGVSVRIDWDSTGAMIYEAVIPLNTFYKNFLMAKDTAGVLGLKITINALEMPEMGGGRGMPRGSSGMPGGGMPGGGGGRPGGGRPGGRGGDRSALFNETGFAVKFRLSARETAN